MISSQTFHRPSPRGRWSRKANRILEVGSDAGSFSAYSSTRERANRDEKVLAGSRGDEWSRGEDEMVAAMTGHKKADAVSLERDFRRVTQNMLYPPENRPRTAKKKSPNYLNGGVG